MENVKVYLYYLKSDKSLYAFTIDKSIKDEFELERCMKLYRKRTKEMNAPQFQAFSWSHNNEMLFCNTLSDGENDISFATTYSENFELEKTCQNLEDKVVEILKKVNQFPLQKKIRKMLDNALEYYGDGVNESIYHFDTFKIFLRKFRNTIIMR